MNWRRELKPMNLLLLAGIAFCWRRSSRYGGRVASAIHLAMAKGPQVPKAPTLRDQQPLSAFRIVAAKNLLVRTARIPPWG